jgi:hypothetical protein
MKNKLLVLGCSLMFLTLCLSGCEFLEQEDYITVNIKAYIVVSLINAQGITVTNDTAEGVLVHIWMVKDGGERITFDKYTENSGGVVVTGSFKLYKEQPIECSAGVVDSYKTYKPGQVDAETLTWETVDAAADFGGTYAWEVYLFPDLREPLS